MVRVSVQVYRTTARAGQMVFEQCLADVLFCWQMLCLYLKSTQLKCNKDVGFHKCIYKMVCLDTALVVTGCCNHGNLTVVKLWYKLDSSELTMILFIQSTEVKCLLLYVFRDKVQVSDHISYSLFNVHIKTTCFHLLIKTKDIPSKNLTNL